PRLDVVERAGHLAAEEHVETVEQRRRGRYVVDGLAVVPQRQVQAVRADGLAVSQGQPGEGLADVARLGGHGLEELAADRRVVEEGADLNWGAGRAVPGPYPGHLTALALDAGAAVGLRGARLERHLGDAADGGQGLAAEAERADAEQVGGAVELA